MLTLRPYQQEAIDAVLKYWSKGGGNPLVDMATGTGKSMVIAKLVQDLLTQYDMRVLMLVHVRELVAQNYSALLKVWPDAPAGIYSAGLGKRDVHHRIVFASIQSVFRKAKALGKRDLILIDEAHLVPAKGEGMYVQLLDALHELQPDARVAGFSATPYRMDSGRLDGGGKHLFTDTVYEYGISKGIEDGYLSPLVSKAGLTEIDVSDVQKRGGEFVPAQIEAAADKITSQAVSELMDLGKDRKSWLLFCAGVQHAINVRDAIRATGISCETVTGETPSHERDRILRQFKAGEIRALTNAQVLTTGFDAPNVDLVGFLRSTLSTSLYVQICGRGTRLSPNKENCLVLDWGGNIRRHGPVDSVSVGISKGGGSDETGKVAVDSVRAKECPECKTLAALNQFQCKNCDHEWPRDEKPKHEAEAEGHAGILSSENVPPLQVPVVDWKFDRHTKMGSPDSVRVTYIAGVMEYREWLAFEHGGFASQKAAQWWSAHGGGFPIPKTVDEALGRHMNLTMPKTISVKKNGKYFNIVGRSLPEREAA